MLAALSLHFHQTRLLDPKTGLVSIHNVKLHAHVVAFFGLVLDLKILWVQAYDRYDHSVQLNWNSPQDFITTFAVGVSIGVLILCNVYYMCCLPVPYPGKKKRKRAYLCKSLWTIIPLCKTLYFFHVKSAVLQSSCFLHVKGVAARNTSTIAIFLVFGSWIAFACSFIGL